MSDFCDKINNLQSKMQSTNNDTSIEIIRELIIKNKMCKFNIESITVSEVEHLIKKCKDRPAGIDYLDVKFPKLVSNVTAVPVCYLIKLSIRKGVCPQAWKIAKVVPLSKNPAVPFCGSNSHPISLLPALGKIMERIICKIL